jgi:short-subunit dehydrogenase
LGNSSNHLGNSSNHLFHSYIPQNMQTPKPPKTALVTGATSGIGRELATLFARDGYDLIMVARDGEALQAAGQLLQRQFGITTLCIAQDLAHSDAAEQVFQETERQGFRVDVLVNDAGMGEYGKFATESDLQKELTMIQLNVNALVHLTKLYLPQMMERENGKILMLGSIASVVPNPMLAVYGATKAFVYSFAAALRDEIKDTKVTITTLMPPPTDTNFFKRAGAAQTKAQEEAWSNPAAEIAKTGYEALMKGQPKVAPGFKTKILEAASHILPDSLITNLASKQMLPRIEDPQKKKKQNMQKAAMGAGAAVLAAGGVWLAVRRRQKQRS